MTEYETFDDDITDDEPDEAIEAGEPAQSIPSHPLGVFSREFHGRTIWFHNPSPSQMTALARLHATTRKKVDKATGENVMRIVFDFNNSSLTLIESLILDPEDVNFLQDSMLSGEVEIGQVLEVLWPVRDPDDDDVEPEPVVKKPKKAARTVSKAVANAQRSKRR